MLCNLIKNDPYLEIKDKSKILLQYQSDKCKRIMIIHFIVFFYLQKTKTSCQEVCDISVKKGLLSLRWGNTKLNLLFVCQFIVISNKMKLREKLIVKNAAFIAVKVCILKNNFSQSSSLHLFKNCYKSGVLRAKGHKKCPKCTSMWPLPCPSLPHCH